MRWAAHAEKLIGTHTDFMKDAFESPFELGIALAKNIDNPHEALKAALREQLSEITTNGDVAASVEGCTEGVIQFAADFNDFALAYVEACAAGTVEGDPFAEQKLAGSGRRRLAEPIGQHPAQ